MMVNGIYDVKMPKKLNGIKFYSSYEELINSDLDAIFICAYNTVLAKYTNGIKQRP